MKRAIKTTIIFSLIYVVTICLIISNASASTNYVARGDSISINEVHPDGTCWYFPDSGMGIFYDIPVSIKGNQSYCILQNKDTLALEPMGYTLVYEESTYANGKYFKDVSWVNNTLVSAFSRVHSIDESGIQAPRVMNDLQRIITSNGFNTFSTDRIVIQEPDIKLSDFRQTWANEYTAGGTSNLANGTPITVKIDEEGYFSQHTDNFTYHTNVIRPSDQAMGTWRSNMPMPIQEMPPGWHTISVYAGELKITSQFRIDMQEWGPAPTPKEYVKYLSNGNIAPEIVTVVKTQVVIQYQDRWHTATPTPDITDALGKKIEYPYARGGKIPEYVAIIALILIAGLVLVRGRKLK